MDIADQAISCASCGAASEWISIDDRYPAEGSWVICATNDCHKFRISAELFYDGKNEFGHHWLRNGDWNPNVTHWMPLPQPPEIEE